MPFTKIYQTIPLGLNQTKGPSEEKKKFYKNIWSIGQDSK